MRVLIALALIGVASAGEAILSPLGYSSLIVDEPKPSYEYSTSVNTPTYNNYAHVRSGGNLERKFYNFVGPIASPAIAAEPIVAEAKFIQPAIAQPILKAAAINEYRTGFPIAAPEFTIPTTKLLPIAYEQKAFAFEPKAYAYEPKPLYRFAAPAPAVIAAAPAAAQVLKVENKFYGAGKSQYYSQNELGEATYGHREPFQQHDAVQDAQGNKAGSFSYVAPDGRLLTTEYIADQAGYRVASNAFPNAPNAANAVPLAAAQPIIAAVEKPAEIGDSEIIVEAKSRSRRSVAIAPAVSAAPLITSRQLVYNNPYAYSYSPLSYSYAPSLAQSYSSYSYTPSFYNAPLYRSYAYPSYQTAYPYYRTLPFRK